jgi:hypothetical protein
MPGHDWKFTSSNYGITSTPEQEWLYIVGDEKGRLTCPHMEHGRSIVPIEDLLLKPEAKHANLNRAEMIAIVLYTGPMFTVYNGILRRHPDELYNQFRGNGNTFSTTIFILVSAVSKLSTCMKINDGLLLYRGLGGTLDLPESFTRADENGCKGYTEFGFISTTADRNVAVEYSGVKHKKPLASIMEIRPNAIDRGADISEFSQYQKEKEFLFVPMSYVQGEGRCRVEKGPGGGVLKVFSVRININLKTETSDQLRSKKKSMHLTAFKALIDETRQWMLMHLSQVLDDEAQQRTLTNSHNAVDDKTDAVPSRFIHAHKTFYDMSQSMDGETAIKEAIEQLQKMQDADRKLPDDDYVDDLKYKTLVTRMLSAQAWAREKLKMWLQDRQYSECFIPLKASHRRWLAFLKQREYAVAAAGSAERKQAATKILQCKGLMATDNVSTEQDDGEPLIYKAAADGWAVDDVQVRYLRVAYGFCKTCMFAVID